MKTMTDDEIRAQRKQCADCGGALEEIKVLQNGHLNVLMPMMYYSKDAEENSWRNVPRPEGAILAFRCSRCARVYLYGAALPKKRSAKTEADNDR